MTTASVATHRSWSRDLPHATHLALHLAGRQLRATHRRTALGWAWPLVLQLATLGVLWFLFGRVIPLDIEHYPVYVFSGLVFWTWLQTGLLMASASVSDARALVMEPRMPTAVLPIAALGVAFFDVLAALPVLAVLLGLTVGFSPAIAVLPLVIVAQAFMMAGMALMVSAANVYVRDIRPLVAVVLLITFYLTPVFYDLAFVPPEFAALYRVNPLVTLLEAYHDVLYRGVLPEQVEFAGFSLFAIVVLAVGVLGFRRLSPGFADEL